MNYSLNARDFINVLAIITSMIIPLIVMFFTIRAGNVRQKKALDAQRAQFNNQIQMMQAQHQEQLSVQNTLNQLAIIPFLNIHQLSGALEERGAGLFYVIKITFRNIGLGPATRLTCMYKFREKSMPLVTESDISYYICDIPFDLYTNTVPIGETCDLVMRRELKPEYVHDDAFADGVELTIAYNDTKQNSYHQRYDFLMGDLTRKGEISFSQIHVGEPELQ